MEINEIWGYIISAVSGGGLTQLVNWRLNKKKAGVELQQSEVAVIAETVRSVYEPIIRQQNERIDELNKEVKQLREEKRQMQEDYQKQIKALEERMLALSRAVGFKATQQARDPNNGRYVKNEKP